MTHLVTRRMIGSAAPLPRAILTAVLLVFVAVLVPYTRAQGAQSDDGADANAPSPGGANAEVIAQGVTSLPTGEIAWRVVEDTAEPLGEGAFEERALGFAVATDDALLLTDEGDGARVRLGQGEAAFTDEGASQRRESLGESSTTYLRVALVPAADASEVNGDALLFGGNAFAAPEGDRDIDLVGVRLDAGETASVPTSAPALVIVLAGAVMADDTDLSEGESADVEGTVELEANEDGTRVLVAVIGPEVPGGDESADSTPVASDNDSDTDDVSEAAGTGQVVVLTELCPAGVTAEQAQDTSAGDPCFGGAAVTAMTVSVTNLETGETITAGVEGGNASAFITDLPAGSYQIVFDTGADLGHTYGVCGGQDSSADLPVVLVSESVVQVELPADREYLCVTRTLQLAGGADAPAAVDGYVSGNFFLCPAGMTFATLDTSQCPMVTDGFDFGIQGTQDYALADAEFAGGSFTWGPFDASQQPDFSLVAYAYPAGSDWYAATVNGGPILEPHAGGFVLTPDQPVVSFGVYFISK